VAHKIRLRPAPANRRQQFRCHRAAYEAFYRGHHIGLIFTRVIDDELWWCVWQDNHGHDAKGRYRRRGDAKRSLLHAVIRFRTRHPEVYGLP
jgi:hypothetical protein